MAEFKLGRIRFVWKNDWQSNIVYYKDDVIAFGGKIYICVLGHTSAEQFFTDLDIVPSKWNLVSDGQSWKGDWQPQTEYIYDDIVKYGARLYICQTIHTSADDSTTFIDNDLAYWQVFAEGLEWRGEWDYQTNYKINDIVKYGGSSYVCTTAHVSALDFDLGLEADSANWDLFNKGFDYKDQWTPSFRYKENDVVKYGAGLWIATTYHNSQNDFSADIANWEKFVEGFQFEEEWNYQKSYESGDVVRYGGNQYIAKRENDDKIPTQETADWSLYSEGLKFVGDWGEDSSAFEYKVGEVVRLGGFTYRCIQDHQNQQPPALGFWERLNSGFDWRGEWLDSQEYFEGDVVRFGDNSYVCIQSHISEGDDYSSLSVGAEGSRPDLADSGQYWSVIAVGSEQSVLTTKGDLVYYSGSAPTRLPIGKDGQILQVSNAGLPEWAFLGVSDDVYYVAEHGRDNPAPIYGKSIDRPFRSIRYAAQQIEKGTKNPEASKLLKLNRKFIQREIVEWTDYQIANVISPFATDFAYNSVKCERDMGYIVDALIWDITHGGNVRTREAALSYVNETAGSPYLTQKDETIASINYGLLVIQNVLNQTDPTVNYQVLNGDNSTAIVVQATDSTLSSEDGVYTDIQDLIKIITDAIADGTDTNIPARLINNTLIKVSTGKFYEVLPIIVPAECCIIGDELRSTKVQPRKEANSTLTPKSDFTYSFEGLTRLESIIGDVVTGTAVTPTTGNTLTQDQSWPYAETDIVAPAVKKLARNIRRRADIGIGEKEESILTPRYDMAQTNFGYHRDLFLRNKDFIKAEIIAYIADQYPNLDYSRTKCKQDVGFIVDAVAYDVTYGGNWQSVNVGEAYYNGRTGVLQIDTTEKTATLAAYVYLKELIQTTGRNITVTPTYQTAVTQVTGTGGDLAVSNFIEDLFTDISGIINNGPGTVAIEYPSIADVSANLLAENNNVLRVKDAVQVDTIDFINENFGSFKYKSSKCRRDLDNIITDISYDVALGTNYNATFNGIAYQRPNNAYNLQNQRIETVGSIRNARDLLKITVTSDGSSEVGSSNASDRIQNAFNEIVDIINNGSLGTAVPGDGTVDALVLPSPAGVDQNRVDAKNNLQANIAFMQEDVIAYIAQNYGSLVYDEAKCRRDVEYIINSQSYDILYGGTMATTRIAESYFVNGTNQVDGQTVETSAAYDHLASIMAQIVQEQNVTAQTGNTELQTTLSTPASATEAAEIQVNVELISDVIDGTTTLSAVQAARTYPSITWTDAEYQTAFSDIQSDKDSVIKETIQYITNTYDDFKYDHDKCSRDLGLILDAARYDWMLGSNFASIVAAYSYLREPSSKVIGNQKDATIAANEFARQQFLAAMSDSDAITGLNTTWEWVEDTIWAGSAEGGNNAVDDEEVYNAILQLERNKEFIVEEVLSHVDEYFKDTVTTTAGDGLLTISDTSWLKVGMPLKFTNPDDSAGVLLNALIDENATYYVYSIESDTTFYIESAPGAGIQGLGATDNTYFVEKAYNYDRTLCARDVREYIEAIQWDLTYPRQWTRDYTDNIQIVLPAVYKTRLGARYYVNSVIGSQEEDMYYLRNGTGIRLQTLDGLQGDLGPANEFGTQRPTAGAYASLDPGWGPDDERVWITARSPYVQNVTTFGFAATGQRIDGALHNGGNDSIVSNDFTQVISDGIGAHILNNGRAELVSVFTYYSHIGYLAETGGRIRATNGNNSYGTFGSVAEGVDPDEDAVTAIVDNGTQYNATIANVFTDNDQLLALEFDHAGNDYTEANINMFGPGDNEVILADEFRDDAVSQVRISEAQAGEAGGSGYTVVSNTAQSGSTTGIFLAATDGNLSTAYPGMKLYITGGAAIGQFAIIDTYDSGTKEATVVRESDGAAGWDHVVPGTAIVAPNSTSTYEIEPRVEFSAPTRSQTDHTITSGAYSDLHYFETSAQYTSVATSTESDGSNATFDVTRNGEKYYLTIASGGLEYKRLDDLTILGTDIGGVSPLNDITVTATTVNETTGAIIDFDFNGIGQKGIFVALPGTTGSTAAQTSIDGQTWSSLTLPDPGGANTYADIASGLIDDGSSTFKQSFAVAVGQGYQSAVYTTDGVTWTESALPGTFATAGATNIAFGQISNTVGRFVAISANDSDVVYSDNGGQTWTSVASPLTGTNYTALAYGKGLFVAIRANTTDTMYSEDGITWTGGSGLPNENWTDITWGNGRFVAISSDSDVTAYSIDGKNWVQGQLPLSGEASDLPNKIAYGQGMFAVSRGSAITQEVAYSQDGINWSDLSVSGATNAIAFGNPNRTGKFITIAPGITTEVSDCRIGAQAYGRASVANEQIFAIRLTEPGSGYDTAPTITITDPNNIDDVLLVVRTNSGAISQPTFVNRGSGYTSASAEIDGENSNGSADFFQDGSFIAVRRLSARPVAGSNVEFESLPGRFFKLVNTVSFRGTNDGSLTAFLQVSPALEILEAPADGDPVEMRIRFSQVRLTGHDFLDIGTGNFADSNYPGVPVNTPNQENETLDEDGGRVFYTATDQDGNFRVGDLFSVEQATGVATLNADAFNIAGLQELSLGEVTLGGNSASISEFSTDPFFTANSDSVVPTQRAVKAYIEAQIGGGGAVLNVNSVTAGDIFIGGNQITTVSGEPITIKANVVFEGTVLGLPLAYNYFLR